MAREQTWGLLGGVPKLVDLTTGFRRPTFQIGEGYVAQDAGHRSPLTGGVPSAPSQDTPAGSDAAHVSTQQGSAGDNPNNLLNTAGRVTGLEDFLPGQTLDERLQPRTVETPWGTDFTTRPGRAIELALPGPIGAAARLGGELSRRNLERIHGRAQAERGVGNPDLANRMGVELHSPEGDYGFIEPNTIPGVTTPIARSPGLLGFGQTQSGSLEHAANQAPWADTNNDGRLSYQEALVAADPNSDVRQAYQAREDEIARIQEERRVAAQRAADEARRVADEQAAREAAAEAARLAELARVRDAQGTATSVQNGQVFYSGGHDWSQPTQTTVRDSGGDSGGGGGGGGGTWCCTAAMKHGMPVKKIKALRKWHRQQSEVWQNGYDRWGYYIAEKLVKKSKFWAEVTEAGHDWFVNRYYTPKGALAWAVIVPGSYIAGWLDAVQK